LPRDPDFVIKPGQHAGIFSRGFGKKFESHGLAETQVVRAINFAHSAFAQASENPVALRDLTARRKTAFVKIGA